MKKPYQHAAASRPAVPAPTAPAPVAASIDAFDTGVVEEQAVPAETVPLGEMLRDGWALAPHGVGFWLHGIETRLQEIEFCMGNVMPQLPEGELRERLQALREML